MCNKLKKGCSPIIKHHELEKKLYEFYSIPEFRDLFQGICVKKDYIHKENSCLDLGVALNTAQLFGLLTQIHGVGETRSIISIDEDIAQEIIADCEREMVDKMSHLFDAMIEQDNKKKHHQISEAESVMGNFMNRLDNGNLIYSKEPSSEIEETLDENFINEQVKSYSKLLKSSLVKK